MLTQVNGKLDIAIGRLEIGGLEMKHRLFVISICLVFAAFLSSVSVADLADGLVGYWPLDGDGTDISGNGIDGTINGNVTPVEDRFGNPDSALQFPGTADSHVAIQDTEELQIAGAMTLAAWVIVDPGMQGNNNGRIVSKQAGGGSRSWSLNTENADLPATFQVAGDGNTIIGVDGSTLPTDEWVHIAGVYRPGEVLEVYVNGKLDATNTSDIPDEQFSTNGQPVLIGARNACDNCGWLGSIDDVVIYNRDLSESEIPGLMSNGPFAAVEPDEKLATAWGAIK
jgi:hypothetical protein